MKTAIECSQMNMMRAGFGRASNASINLFNIKRMCQVFEGFVDKGDNADAEAHIYKLALV